MIRVSQRRSLPISPRSPRLHIPSLLPLRHELEVPEELESATPTEEPAPTAHSHRGHFEPAAVGLQPVHSQQPQSAATRLDLLRLQALHRGQCSSSLVWKLPGCRPKWQHEGHLQWQMATTRQHAVVEWWIPVSSDWDCGDGVPRALRE